MSATLNHNMLLYDVGVVSMDMPGILMRAGGREGRKEGEELEWAAVPVLRRLNFKHSLLFNQLVCWGQRLGNWPFRASMNGFPVGHWSEKLLLSASLRVRTQRQRVTACYCGRDAESGLVLLYLSVSSSCLLRWWLPAVAHRGVCVCGGGL